MDYRERWELKEYQSEQRLGRRIALLHVAMGAVLVGFVLALWYLQVTRGEEYAALAESNRLRRIPVPPTRGAILDRNDEVLASTRPSLNLLLVRDELRDADAQIERLARVLGMDAEPIRERLRSMRGRPTFEPLVIREDLGLPEVARVEARREWFPNVEIEQSSVRSYPDGPAVAHAIGYVGEVGEAQVAARAEDRALEPGDIVGKSGVERAYDDRLRGRRGWKLVTVNAVGRPFGESRIGREPVDGQGIRLTIDARLQRKLVEAFGEESGAGVFLDPRTGEVLALASLPGYDPNVFAGQVSPGMWRDLLGNPGRPLHDRAIGSFYAPGSTFKIVMSIAGLESGGITPSSVVHCGGSVNLYGRPFLCWKKGGHGTVAVHQALVHSCNVFYYTLGNRIGIDAITKYASMLGLGRLTDVDLPGEARGIVPSAEWKQKTRGEPWYAGDTISVSIGQGLMAVTPVQMATMVSAVATGAVPAPHLVKDGGRPPVPLDVAPLTLAVVRSALADVVEAGTGRRAQLGPIPVAGKTGTAQVLKKSAGIDADKLPKNERDHAWFVGYAPADAPEIAFAVVVEHGGHGGTTAAPIARQVLEVFFRDRLEEVRERQRLTASVLAGPETHDRSTPATR